MSHAAKLSFIRLAPSPETITDGAVARRHFEATKSLMTALAGLLAGGEHGATISLELVAKEGTISYVIASPADWAHELKHHLYAAFPGAEVTPLPHWSVFDVPGKLAAATIQFVPPEGQLRSEEFSGNDPLQPLLEVLAATKSHERLCVQLTLAASHSHEGMLGRALGYATDGLRLVLNGRTHDPDHKKSHEEDEDSKEHNAPLRASLRVIASAQTATAAKDIVRRVTAAYHQLALPGKTSLRYEIPRHLDSWLHPTLRRRLEDKTSFLLTAIEAANLYHTPLRVRELPQLIALASTRLPIPDNLPAEGINVGHGAFRDSAPNIHLSPADRLRHTYLIGQTGTGKSTLFQSAILQDIQNGDGACFIDPHGEVIDWLLPRIPPERAKDVVLFDPSDPEAILGLNLLEWRTPHERDLLIQELILLFYKLFDPDHTGIIGPQFEHWLRNAALTITEPAIRGTLVDIPRLFTDKAYQTWAVSRSTHPAVLDFWNNQMAATADFHKSEMLNYFTSKFGSFLGNTVMSQILSQPTSAFDMRSLMDDRRILLINLSKGRLGSLNAQLLGTLIITKLQMAAMSRADVPADQRPPFYVYIDEFQNVVTDSFAQMLSEIRKYGVGLHLAHQYVDQLPDNIKQAVAGNIGTLMAFRLGRTDAMWLKDHFSPLTADDLTDVPPYQYHLRTLAHGQLAAPFTVQSPQLITAPNAQLEHAIRQRMRNFVSATKIA